ncbi:MAG TPA: hypothetical protein VI564_02435 [Candidatus Nanoarchaeia archaeon]|nr:hypothetical protein [Candidatus Nanoarchaeia archaeon]
MTLGQKRAQMVTFDLIIGIMIFILFIGLFVGLFFYFQNNGPDEKYDFEIEYVYANLEKNLEVYQSANPLTNFDFFRGYRINRQKLSRFYSEFKNKDVDQFVVSYVAGAHGIGLDSGSYDSCIYITDNDLSEYQISGAAATGLVKGSTCDEKIRLKQNPCKNYRQAISLTKPVLLDEGDVLKNRILQLNIVLCKI